MLSCAIKNLLTFSCLLLPSTACTGICRIRVLTISTALASTGWAAVDAHMARHAAHVFSDLKAVTDPRIARVQADLTKLGLVDGSFVEPVDALGHSINLVGVKPQRLAGVPHG